MRELIEAIPGLVSSGLLKARTDEDFSLIMERLKEQADKGDDKAAHILAWFYKSDRFRNAKQYLHYETKAAGSGLADAELSLGRSYLSGQNVDKNEKLGESLLEKALERGNAEAGTDLLRYWGNSSSSEQALKTFCLATKLSSKSVPVAQEWVAVISKNPVFLKNIHRSAELYKSADLPGPLADLLIEYLHEFSDSEVSSIYEKLVNSEKKPYMGNEDHATKYKIQPAEALVELLGKVAPKHNSSTDPLEVLTKAAEEGGNSWASFRIAEYYAVKSSDSKTNKEHAATWLGSSAKQLNPCAAWVLLRVTGKPEQARMLELLMPSGYQECKSIAERLLH